MYLRHFKRSSLLKLSLFPQYTILRSLSVLSACCDLNRKRLLVNHPENLKYWAPTGRITKTMSIYCSQRQYYVCNCQIKFTCLSGVFITKESMCGIQDHFRFVCRCFVILKRKWRQTYYFKSSLWRPYEFFHCLQPNLQSMAASVYSITRM